MVVFLEKVKWFTIWMRTLLIMLWATLYYYQSGFTGFSILAIVIAGLKFMETIWFELLERSKSRDTRKDD